MKKTITFIYIILTIVSGILGEYGIMTICIILPILYFLLSLIKSNNSPVNSNKKEIKVVNDDRSDHKLNPNISTDTVFQKWISNHGNINWKDPKEVKRLFIIWGDYVKDEYIEHQISEGNIKKIK